MADETKEDEVAPATLWLSTDESFAFLAIKKVKEEDFGTAFATGTEDYIRDVVERWRAGEAPKSETDQVPEPELPLETTQEATLHEALQKGIEFARSQAHLIAITSVAPSLFEAVHVATNILDPITDSGTPVHEDEIATVYPLSSEQHTKVVSARRKLVDLQLGVAALPNATLMSLVATFDALIVDLIAKMLRLDKSWMSKGDRKLGFDKLAEAETLDALIADAIGEELYQFSRGSHDEQAKYIETNFGVSIRSHWKRWPDYIEVFERRNLIAHGESNYNKRYVSICSSSGHKGSDKLLGSAVEVRHQYLRQALDVLTEFAILLPFSVWRKLSEQEEEKAFSQLNEAAYNLIMNGHHVAAERVLEFALGLTKVKVPANVIYMLTINRASALRHAGHEDQAKAVLKGVDWSASSDLFQICMHAVNGDAEEVAKLLPKFEKSTDLNAVTFKQWPCFKFVRDDDAVREAFLKTFGESLQVPASQTSGAEKENSSPNPGDLPTVH